MSPRYALLLAVRSGVLVAPLAAAVLVLLGTYAYRPNDAAPTYALTAVLAAGVGWWWTVALRRAEPAGARDLRTTLGGGRRRTSVAHLRTDLAVAGVLATAFVSFPLAAGGFTPQATAREVAVAAGVHLLAATWGAVAGRLRPVWLGGVPALAAPFPLADAAAAGATAQGLAGAALLLAGAALLTASGV